MLGLTGPSVWGLAFSAGAGISKMSPYLPSSLLYEQERMNISFSLHSRNIVYISFYYRTHHVDCILYTE